MHIENDYLVLDEQDIIKSKKIAGHSFVGLIGYDSFKPVGDTLLSMYGLVKEQIDPKWLKRGDFAESIVKHVYTRDGHQCTTYDKNLIKYDNFKDNNMCGGLIDIELLEEHSLIEVKSKSMKNYSYILKQPPIQEIYQGLYYGYLRNYENIIMEWIFFDEETENEIFNDKKPTTLKNLKRYSSIYKVDRNELKNLIDSAIAIKNQFEIERKIELSKISDKYLQMLGLKRPNIMDELLF